MPRDDKSDAFFKGLKVETTAQTKGRVNMVGSRLEGVLLQKPETLLCG